MNKSSPIFWPGFALLTSLGTAKMKPLWIFDLSQERKKVE